jgi:cardiolipin synthase
MDDLAVPLYFLIGNRKRVNKKYKPLVNMHKVYREPMKDNPIDGILKFSDLPNASYDNHYEIITDDIKAYEILIKNIRNARTSIYLSTYVFKYDEMTKHLIEELCLKADSGVEVKLLIDSLGSWKLYLNQRPLKKLLQCGAQVTFFMPILKIPFRNYINLRNHRKIYIFDKNSVLSGGMNLTNEYLGEKEDSNRWDDMLYFVQGSCVFDFYEVFINDWNYATNQTNEIEVFKPSKQYGDTIVQVVPSGPDISGDALYEALLSSIYFAKKRIWIVTPYFVPDKSLMQALIIAHHKGVDVKLITPKDSNHLVADLGRSSYMRELEDMGIHVALYEGKMLHAKAIMIDEEGVMLGTVNFDNRSLFLNYEIVTIAYSEQLINDVDNWMKSLLRNTTQTMKPATNIRRLGENLMRIFAPML